MNVTEELRGQIAYALTKRLVIDMPTARAAVDAAVKAALSHAPSGAGEARAWFVKDYADGWVHFDNEADALREVEAMGPGTMMMVGFPPYALPATEEKAAAVKPEDVASLIPDTVDIPPMTDRGPAGQVADAAWPIAGGNHQPYEFWHAVNFGILLTLKMFPASPIPTPPSELEARCEALEKALTPFGSGGEWGKVKAWVVEGAPDRAEGIAAAKRLTTLQVVADAALANGGRADG